jgi:hypothetical protein
MGDREFWLAVRSALIMIIRAIEKRYLKDVRPLDIAEEG